LVLRLSRKNGDRDVDEEGPSPRGVLREDAAHNETDRRATPGDPSVDPESPCPFLRLGEGRREEGESRGCHDGGERSLERPRTEQHRGVLRETSESRGTREAEKADDEHPLAPEVVGDAAPEQEQATEREGVGGEDPLAVRYRDPESVLGRGEGDRHYRSVEDDHELGDGDDA
jgi:hypothetical protein